MSVTDRLYPLPAPADDSRFTIGLIVDVRDVLTAHGYPHITSGEDFVELQQALFRFLYAPITTDETTPGGIAPMNGEEC